ncbi:hypothetical protein [Sphingopyxis sp. JAI128]|uniref:hypothetical protein n=1 Tax=Sphingopyxis sp. JAI128 TaxID=2723066 RepID=UPI00160E0BAD|nr:hypothetical protein [Sphingopyxis sp. JAI128]
MALAVSGCATIAFKPPPYSYSAPNTAAVALDSTNSVHVLSYLRGVTDTFDTMLENAEKLKYATELPIIAAGIFAPTALALGDNPDHAIYAAGVGAAGGALSSYFGVRTRQAQVAQARGAITCVNQQYVDQFARVRNLAYSTLRSRTATANLAQTMIDAEAKQAMSQNSTLELLAAMPAEASAVSGDVASAGAMAIAAADEVISRLKIKLASVGTAPDYAAILKDLQDKQALAAAKKEASAAKAITNAADKAIVDALADYQVKIAECLAKFPA